MAIYSQFSIGTADNEVVFNKLGDNPYFRVTRRLPTRRQLKEFDIDLPEGSGIADFETYVGKMYYIIEGKMFPRSEATFHSGREQLRKLASLAVSQEDALSDAGYVPLKWSENINKLLMVKVLHMDMAESTQQGIVQPFRMLCKVKYPVIFSETTVSGSTTAGSSTALGGATIPAFVPMSINTSNSGAVDLPFVLPIVLGGSNSGTGSVTLTNTGDLPAYPTITVTGPISRPRITNVTTGEYLELDVNLTTTGESAIFTYDQDSLSIVAQNVNAYGKLTSGSTLFKVKSGTNVFTLSGASVGSGARMTVSFQSAYSLS